jgi:hypothetical protein
MPAIAYVVMPGRRPGHPDLVRTGIDGRLLDCRVKPGNDDVAVGNDTRVCIEGGGA